MATPNHVPDINDVRIPSITKVRDESSGGMVMPIKAAPLFGLTTAELIALAESLGFPEVTPFMKVEDYYDLIEALKRKKKRRADCGWDGDVPQREFTYPSSTRKDPEGPSF